MEEWATVNRKQPRSRSVRVRTPFGRAHMRNVCDPHAEVQWGPRCRDTQEKSAGIPDVPDTSQAMTCLLGPPGREWEEETAQSPILSLSSYQEL